MDNLKFNLKKVDKAPVLKKYVVTSENGIFKRGKLYKKGDLVDLEDKTAQGFIKYNQVKAK